MSLITCQYEACLKGRGLGEGYLTSPKVVGSETWMAPPKRGVVRYSSCGMVVT